MKKVSEEEKFYFDINNIKKDLEIENMTVTDENINMLRKYYDRQITADDLLRDVKLKIIRGDYKYE